MPGAQSVGGWGKVAASWREWSARTDSLGQRKIPARPLFVPYGLVVNGLLGGLGSLLPLERPWLRDGWAGLTTISIGLLLTAWVQWAIARARSSVDLRQAVALIANGCIYGGLLFYLDGATTEATTTGLLVLFVFFVSAHAFQYQVTARSPWFLLPLVLDLIGVAIAGRREPLLYGLTALWLLPACVVLGNASARLDAALQAESLLRQRHAALLLELRERENARLTEFLDRLAGHTHDLGGPALALSAALERLERGDANAAVLSARMARDLRDLIAMITEAKGEVRRVGLPPIESALVDEAVLAVGERMRLRYPQRDISVREGKPVRVDARGGTSALARAVENVSANAAAAAGHRVRLSWSVVDETVEVSVEDDGPGMPSESELGEGGLGLASTRRVVQTSGGELSIDRSLDLGGARVRLRLRRAS